MASFRSSVSSVRQGPDGSPGRWFFLRDVLVLQLKLFVDGLRDAVLIPVSLTVAALDLVTRPEAPGRWFYPVVVLGRRSEHWIDLFEAADRFEPRRRRRSAEPSLDEIVGRLEAVLVDQQRRGGVTAAARQKIDRLLDSVGAGLERRPKDETGEH